jgi:acyl-CoA thioesterase I
VDLAGKRILFQGDSITDAHRSRDDAGENSAAGLGVGYANLVASHFLASQPTAGMRFLNRGISGHRVVDLYARWKVDALNLQPNVISILVGINDTWHEFNNSNGVELPRFETIYRLMLQMTREALPDVALVLCEPFALPCGEVTADWLPDVAARIDVVHRLAAEFGAVLVPFQQALNVAVASGDPAYWAYDGVHPTPAGHRCMADCWLQAVATA